MRQVTLLLSAGLAAALVVRSPAPLDQVLLAADDSISDSDRPAPSWWGAAVGDDHIQALEGTFEGALEEAELAVTRILRDDDGGDGDHGKHGKHGKHGHHGHHGDPSKTIYELIKESKYTTKFAELVDEHDDIKDLLQSTETNRTLFVPTDRVFERIPDGHKKPPAEFIRAYLAYSIAPGRFPARRLFFKHTIPSELKLDDLGGHAQRIRVSASLIFGTHLNFFTKIVARDIEAKNGLIHAVDGLLLPPPPTDKIIQLLPDTFSTYSLALATTNLVEELPEVWTGATAFVPTNRAFARLGPRVNAFLFSDHGKKYLKALLKYGIVANQTLYSDAFYKAPVDDDDDDKRAQKADYWHVDLPSLLDDKPIAVDVRRWKGFVSIVANGYTRVAVQDVLGSDGVLQVTGTVLIPPHKRGHGEEGQEWEEEEEQDDDREWEVEELKARLDPYLEGFEETEKRRGDL
ncbi:Fasciclin domain-containing protein [Echria macrotheca]|uniref:Fasciclin domain-containing protein n=1 Tax=Echria macrotheca TaxID=438768 RepID=A0AAJ0B6L3_9PEZI|nr:Fasciclin domain-containing protein [Echria macrotheca]